MLIETFDSEGQLIESRIVENIPKAINMAAFIRDMMRNEAYNNLVFNHPSQILVNRLELGITRLEIKAELNPDDLQDFKYIWDEITDTCNPNYLNEVSRQHWNELAITHSVPIQFDEDFRMIISDGTSS